MTRTNQFQRTLWELQRRMGANALVPLSRLSERETIPTGFEDIDQLLGGKGIRSGQVTALCGRPSSGVTSLTYSFIAQAQRQSYMVFMFDLGETFDAYSAARWGVVPGDIVAVRSEDALATAEVLRKAIKVSFKLLMVFDTSDLRRNARYSKMLEPLLRQIKGELVKSRSIILVLLPEFTSQTIPTDYDTVLKLEHQQWIEGEEDIYGYRVQATLVKDSKIPDQRTSVVEFMLKDEPL